MATRIVFLGSQETTVSESEEEVVQAVRRDHPNPVKLVWTGSSCTSTGAR
jgi:hypothetical protein